MHPLVLLFISLSIQGQIFTMEKGTHCLITARDSSVSLKKYIWICADRILDG